MNNKRLMKVFSLLLVVALLLAVLPLQAKAQTGPQTLHVSTWTGPTNTGLTGRETILKDGNTYHMWYSNSGETKLYHTFSIDDPDTFPAGTENTFTGGAPVEIGSVSVVKEGGTFYMIAYGGDNSEFAYYTSTDGTNWIKGGVVFDGTGKFVNFIKIDGPFLFKSESGYRLYFQVATGPDYASRSYDIYAAESSTITGTYVLRTTPVLTNGVAGTWDANDVMHPWVVEDDGTYYMWYSGFGGSGNPQKVGMAKSTDGLTWVKSPGNPIMVPATGYAEPSVIKDGNTWRMWTMGTGGTINYLEANGPFEFSSIGSAISKASDGDTILISAGEYAENLTIAKSLTLKSDSKPVTIRPADGTNPTVLITAGVVQLEGLNLVGDPAVQIGNIPDRIPGSIQEQAPNVTIQFCSFGGSRFVVNNTSTEVKAENNWWGNINGPAAGKISGNVDYVPWLKISGLTLDEDEIEENQPIGTKVGTFGFEPEDDLDPDEVYTLALVDTEHYPDNAKFAIAGYELKTAAGLNFEEKTTYSIYVRATDPWGSFYEQQLDIVVLDVNEAPVLTLPAVMPEEVNEGATATFTASATDVDAGQTLTFSLVGAPTGATINIPTAGVFSWTPGEEQGPGEYTFSVKVCDNATEEQGGPLCAEQPVTITVKEVNIAPVAVADTYGAIKNTPRVVAAPGVLANDHDDDLPANPWSVVLVENIPAGEGTLVLNPNGSFTYTPPTDWTGSTHFTYRISDGMASSNTVQVDITVRAANNAPTDIGLTPTSVDENVLFIGNLTTTDSDDSVHTYSLVPGVGADDNAMFEIVGSQLKALETFNFEEKASYKVRIRTTDPFGAFYEEAFTVGVTGVPEAPVLAPIGNKVVDEKTLLTFTATATDEDIPMQPLTFSLVNPPTGATINIPTAGVFRWTPDETQGPGVYTFKVKVCDDTSGTPLCDEEQITVTVNEVNSAPVANDQSVTVAEDNAGFAITLTGSDADHDPVDTLTYSIVDFPDHGSLQSLSSLNPVVPADHIVTYIPVANYNGPDSFTFKIYDGHVYSNIATVSITVTPVNDAPTADNDSYNALKGVSLNIAAPGVLGNDEDIDEDALTAVIAVNASHGIVTLNSDGSFTYVPDATFTGTDTFQYTASDGAASSAPATVTLTVNASNVAPTNIGLSPTSFAENSDYEGTLTATDATGDVHTFSLVTGEGSDDNGEFEIEGNKLIATHQFNFEVKKTYKVRIAATDQFGASLEKAFVITVTDVNDAPVAEDQDVFTIKNEPVDFELTGSDEDGDELTFAIFTEPLHGTLDAQELMGINFAGAGILRVIEPTVTYTPGADFKGTDSFTFKVMDEKGAVSELATVTITVNDVPVAVDDEYATDEDVQLVIDAEEGVLANDDAGGEVTPVELTAVLVDGVSKGELSLDADGSFTYKPNENFFGEDSFTYKACVGEICSEPATVTITIAAVNDAPVAEDIEAETDEDMPVEIELVASDVEGEELTAAIVDEPEHGEVILEGFIVTYTPDLDFNGTDSFTYKVNDGSADSNVATVTITVGAINDEPNAVDDEYDAWMGVTLEVPAPGVLANDFDPDPSDEQTVEVKDAPLHGELVLNPDGSFTYEPDAGFHGIDTFTYWLISEPGVQSAYMDSATVTITVRPVARIFLPIILK